MILLLLGTLTGCAPDDAKVTGTWFTWLAAGSSATVAESDLTYDNATVFECYGRGWDAAKCDWQQGYIGPGANGTDAGYDPNDRFIGGACARQYSESTGICDGGYVDDCGEEDLAGFAAECSDIDNLEFHDWAKEDGYYGLSDKITPWRTEALINAEGDLQLTTHVALEAGQDFRFHFTIDPDFAPTECLEDEEGNTTLRYMDNSNWLDEWSEDEDGYTIYYLNAGSYQVNPNDSENSWYLSNDMNSGYGFAKFAEEDLNSHAGDYGHYEIDGTGPSFLGIEDFSNPDMDQYAINAALWCAEALGDDCPLTNIGADGLSWQDEMVTVLGANNGEEALFEHKFEDNMWRPVDGTVTGLDGWMELHSSWVRLENGTTVAAGENVKGDFQILYEGAESGSRVLVRGEFEITELEDDPWGYEILEDAKRIENKTPYCGGASLEE